MPQPSVSLTLYGDKAATFREIKEDLESRKGFDLTNADVGAELMAVFNQSDW